MTPGEELKAGAELAANRIEGNMRRVAEALADARGDDLEDFLAEVGQAKVRSWTTTMKVRDGDGVDHVEQVENFAVEISPKWEDGPEWPVVAPVKVKVTPTRKKAKPPADLVTAVFWPDPQIGFWHDARSGRLYPMHDYRALDICAQITRDVNPDIVVNLGDFLDLADASSKFRRHPALRFQTQPALIDGHTVLAVQRSVMATDADLYLLAGNHDDRLANLLVDNAAAAYGLRKPGARWPALSVPNLLDVDSYGCEYVSGYPAATKWLRESGPGIAVEHGKTTKVAARAKDLAYNVILGHGHHQDVVSNRITTGPGQSLNVKAISPGCLCRVDGWVPSSGSGVDEFGLPVPHVENWNQGLCVASWHPDGGTLTHTLIEITDGTAHFGDKSYTAGVYWPSGADDLDGIDVARYFDKV